MTRRSRAPRAAGFPLATVAAYGPDNTRATKLVVGILDRADDREPRVHRTWTSEDADVRFEPVIAAEVAQFIADQRVERTVRPDRIIGCPHQEGIDYPMGRPCPRCPFWAGIDRFTHEPVSAPSASMSADEVLRLLGSDPPNGFEDALTSADAHRAALVQPLLDSLDRGLVDPAGASPETASVFSYALYLLAKWRDPRAYPYVIRWLSLPEEQPFEIAGDIVTQDGARILAGVYNGDDGPIRALIVNRAADEYGRSAGVDALALLAAWAEAPRDRVIECFLWLAGEGLEREPSAVWDSLAAESADIEALEVFPALRQAYDAGLIDPVSMDVSELDEVEAMPRGAMLERTRERHPPIDDVAVATAWWARGASDADDEFDEPPDDSEDWVDGDGESAPVATPYRAPSKVGRNEPCPCSSGKKYKKCCGR